MPASAPRVGLNNLLTAPLFRRCVCLRCIGNDLGVARVLLIFLGVRDGKSLLSLSKRTRLRLLALLAPTVTNFERLNGESLDSEIDRVNFCVRSSILSSCCSITGVGFLKDLIHISLYSISRSLRNLSSESLVNSSSSVAARLASIASSIRTLIFASSMCLVLGLFIDCFSVSYCLKTTSSSVSSSIGEIGGGGVKLYLLRIDSARLTSSSSEE